MTRVCSSRMGVAATGLPPRSSPEADAHTRVALVHGVMGIRDNYTFPARPCRRVRNVVGHPELHKRRDLRHSGAWLLLLKLPVAPMAAAHHLPALDLCQVPTLSLCKKHCPYCSSPQHHRDHYEMAQDLQDVATTPYSTSPAGTRALHLHATRRRIDHGRFPDHSFMLSCLYAFMQDIGCAMRSP
jgi:hypothetical protein